MQNVSYAGGFTDAPVQAAFAFRSAMTVMARPGEIRVLEGSAPPAPLGVAAGTLVLTLCDPDTGIFLAGAFDNKDLRDWITFHTGAPLVDAEDADFAVGAWGDLIPLDGYKVGTSEYPDRSCTLIAELPHLSAQGATLRGPGIKQSAALSVPDAGRLAINAAQYPLGLDFFFTCGTAVAGLPRSTSGTEG